ncbi:unnamed protein product, partial [Prorocentrum cordatum]
ISHVGGMTDQHYVLTGRDVPEGMQMKRLRWVHVVAQSLGIEEALSLSLLDMSRTGRLWPVAFTRKQRQFTIQMLQCRRDPLRRRVGANASATWIKCIDCDLRLAYWNRPKIEVQPHLLAIKDDPNQSSAAMPNIRRYNKGQDDRKELLIKLVKTDTSRSPAAVKVPVHSEATSRTSESTLAKDMKELKDAILQQNEYIQQHSQALQFLMQPHLAQIQQCQEAAVMTAIPGTPRQADKWGVIGPGGCWTGIPVAEKGTCCGMSRFVSEVGCESLYLQQAVSPLNAPASELFYFPRCKEEMWKKHRDMGHSWILLGKQGDRLQALPSSGDPLSSFPVEGECHLVVRHDGWASAIQ